MSDKPNSVLGKHRHPRDYQPAQTAAGKTLRQPGGESISDCLKIEVPRQVSMAQSAYSTYERMAEPGKRVVHPAQRNDPRPPPEHSFGKSTKPPLADGKLLHHDQEMSVLDRMNASKREESYASAQREPLGKSMRRGHHLPQDLEKGDKAFGVSTKFSVEAKELIFPVDVVEEPEKEAVYKKSHHAFAPGEQKPNTYNWQAVGDKDDTSGPNDFRFGVKGIPEPLGVAKTLAIDSNTETFTKTKVVSLRQGAHAGNTKDGVGKQKPKGQRDPKLPPDHTFGVSTAGRDSWGAGALLRGTYTREEQMPDPDLGKSKRPKEIPGRETRAFGIPSVRTDLPPKARQSVANNQNYGNEPNASGVVFPPKYAHMGLMEDDFNEALDYDGLYKLYKPTGISDQEFDAFYGHATQTYQTQTPTIAQFRHSMLALQ